MSASPLYPSFDFEGPVFRAHEGGKLGVHATQPLRDRDDLSLLYTPGVADVCRAIAADPSLSARYTARRNTVAVITDAVGPAVLQSDGDAAHVEQLDRLATMLGERLDAG